MTYRFDIQHNATGSFTATCGEHSAGSERALARKLVETDAPDGPIEGGTPGKTEWTAPSLHMLAASTLNETDKGFVRGIYAIHPMASNQQMHPALQRAVSNLLAARARRV